MSRDVPDVAVFALVVIVAVSAVAMPTSALTAGATPAGDVTTDGVVAQTTANGTATGTSTESANESSDNESVAPGQQLAGVVGVQGAEIEGEVEERAFATRVARSDSNASKAGVVAADVNRLRERLETLRERRDRLREARRSGNVSTGEYRARMAVLSAETRAVQSQLGSNERVARGLPDEALEANGVNRSELDRLQQSAGELQGPEVAEIARQIAGPNRDRGFGSDRDLPTPASEGNTTAAGPGAGNSTDAGNGSAMAGNSTDAGPSTDDRPANETDRDAGNRSADGSDRGERPDGAGGESSDGGASDGSDTDADEATSD